MEGAERMLAPPLLLRNLGRGRACVYVTVQLPKGEVHTDATVGYWFDDTGLRLRQVSK